MAGDWIKMRSNLWDDPRVARLCDLTDTSEAVIVGGLYWLWATADQHSEDGCMPGLSARSIDRKTGITGFASALIQIGWLSDDPQGVALCRFEEHNGASAKKRAVTAKRVANHRGNADVTQPALQKEDEEVTDALAREREREREETTHIPSMPAQISIVLRKYAINSNPSHPSVIALAEQGVDLETLEACCKETREAKPNETISIGYVLKKLEGWKAQAANVKLTGVTPAKPKYDNWDRSPAGIERKASDLGIYPRAGETHATLAERCRAVIQQQEHAA